MTATNTKRTSDADPAQVGRLLGGVKLQARKYNKERTELERQVVRAVWNGASLRQVAAAAGFGSHHRVQEIVQAALDAGQRPLSPVVEGEIEDEIEL